MLRNLMGKNAKPNNRGFVREILEDGTVMVEFPIGDDPIDVHSQVAPYDARDVRKLDA